MVNKFILQSCGDQQHITDEINGAGLNLDHSFRIVT